MTIALQVEDEVEAALELSTEEGQSGLPWLGLSYVTDVFSHGFGGELLTDEMRGDLAVRHITIEVNFNHERKNPF